jgi:hemolysin activation/secretion protein
LSAAILLAASLVATDAVRGQGQDFQQIAPKQPEKTGEGKVVNQAAPKTTTHAQGDDVLVGSLKGIILLSSPKQVRTAGVTGQGPVSPGDVVLAQKPEFATAVQPWLGKPVTMKSLAELTRAIVAYFRTQDRPVVNVFVPDQNITTGYVQIVAVESHVEKVDAMGAHSFSNNYLRSELRLHPGDPISGNLLRDDVAWINRNPFLQSDVLMAPGDAPGTTDVLLRTKDRFPLRVYAGYEDSGNTLTGNDRYLAGFNYGNLFGVGQQLSYQFTVGSKYNDFYAHSGTYIIPLPWRHIFTVFGSYSAANSNFSPLLASGGVTWQVSGRYEIPLPGSEKFSHSVIGGFDFKRSNNSLIFGGATVSNVFADIDQFVLTYQASYLDDYGSTSGSATGYWSPGKLTDNNTDAAFQATRAGSRADYLYGQFGLNRVTQLPMNFSWTVRAMYQAANANLLPTEELGLGGYSTVRGYEEREANGDDGFLLSTELATPPVSLGSLFGLAAVKDQLQFLGFVDYGGVSLHQATPSDINPNVNLLGVGPGVRYVINPYLSFRFDYGFQLISTGFGNGEHSRGHIGLVISY